MVGIVFGFKEMAFGAIDIVAKLEDTLHQLLISARIYLIPMVMIGETFLFNRQETHGGDPTKTY
jgi:hypothetical protein